MSKRYTFEECYIMLDVHPKTFRRWLKDDKINTQTSKADKRIKFLTEEQVKQLAQQHDKPWPPVAAQEQEVIPVTAYKLLQEQIAQITKQTEEISATLATLQTRIAELHGQEETTAHLDALATTSQEQQKELGQLTSSLDTLEKLTQSIQQDMQTQLEQVQTSLQEQHEQAEKRLQTQLQSALAILRQQIQEEFEQRAQRIEADQTRKVATLISQQEQHGERIEHLTIRVADALSVAEEAKRTAEGNQSHIFAVEQSVTNFATQLQAHMVTNSTITEQSPQETQVQEETLATASAVPVSTRRRTSTKKASETESVT